MPSQIIKQFIRMTHPRDMAYANISICFEMKSDPLRKLTANFQNNWRRAVKWLSIEDGTAVRASANSHYRHYG